jgi:hypothetical protein
LTKGLDQRCAHLAISCIASEAAEIDEIATGKRAARLLQAAARRETAKVDRHEALRDGGRGCSVPKIGNLAGKRFRSMSGAQDHFMAGRQRLSRERQRDGPCADRSEFHDPASVIALDCCTT